MNKADIKLIPLAINNVIATSGSTFNGYHLFNVGNGDRTDNKFFEVKNGKDVGENLYNFEAGSGESTYEFYVPEKSTFIEDAEINDYNDSSDYSMANGYYIYNTKYSQYDFVSSSLPSSN